MNREPRTRREKITAAAAVMLCAMLAGGATWLQKIEAEPEVKFPPQTRLPSPNGYDVYLQAAQTIKPWVPPVSPTGDTSPPINAKARAQRYSLKRREAWLQANAKGFALLRQAKKFPCRDPHPRARMLGTWPYTEFLDLARYAAINTETLKLQGRWRAVTRSGLDIIQLGTDLPFGGGIAAKQTGMEITRMGMRSLEDNPERLGALEARLAVRRLEKLLLRRVTFEDVLEADKWAQIAQFLAYARTRKWRHLSELKVEFSRNTWIRMRTVSKSDVLALIERNSQKLAADIRKPYSAPELQVDNRADILAALLPLPTRLRFDEAWEATGLNMLLLRYALHAYTTEIGTAPQCLEMLCPRYLEAIPCDMFADGAPFHYQPSGLTYRLWSVGPDGKNDGGAQIPIPASRPGLGWEAPALTPESKGDWVAGPRR